MYKKILIIIISDSKLNLLQIYNNNNKIEEVYVKDKYYFTGKINQAYKIKIINNNCILNTSLCISKKINYPYIFDVRNKKLSHKILIKLIDQHYSGLKIEKGKINLWANSII